MASEREQAQSEVYRLESDLRSAKGQVDLHRGRIAREAEEGKRSILKGTLASAENSARNVERALANAQTRLRNAR